MAKTPAPLECKEAIGARLNAARIALEFTTATAFAASLGRGLTPQKWSNYVKGRDRFPVELALILRQKYRISLDWLYGGDLSTLPLGLARRIEEIEQQQAAAAVKRRPKRPR